MVIYILLNVKKYKKYIYIFNIKKVYIYIKLLKYVIYMYFLYICVCVCVYIYIYKIQPLFKRIRRKGSVKSCIGFHLLKEVYIYLGNEG